MKKLFLMMAFAVITLSAAAQKSGFDVKAGFGLSSYMGDAADGADAKFNWKVGAGYEIRINKLIGIEPSLMLNSKGAEYSWWDGNRKFTTTNNLLYLEMPAMCNFHLNRNWVLGAGLYCAYLVDDDDRDFENFDAGLRIGGKYQFDSGFFLGLDASFGGVDLDKHYDVQNITFGTVVGFAF